MLRCVRTQLVTKLSMLDKGRAVVSWRLRGEIGFVPVDVSLESQFTLDLITGRVRSLLRCCPSPLLGDGHPARTSSRFNFQARKSWAAEDGYTPLHVPLKLSLSISFGVAYRPHGRSLPYPASGLTR